MNNNPNERLAPHSIEAEQAVLGAILLDNDVFAELKEILTGQSFYSIRNCLIWHAMEDLYERGMAIDNLTLIEELRRSGEKATGQYGDTVEPAYISHLINNTPTSLYAASYAQVVVEAEKRRRLLDVAGKIASLAISPDIDADEALSKSQQALGETVERATEGKTADFIVSGSDALFEVLDSFGETKTEIAYRTPFPAIWEFGGFCEFITAGKIIMLQGVSGGGKTTISECMGDLLLMDGYNVIQWGGEWNPKENALRRLQRAGGVKYADYMRSQVARNLHQRGIDTTEWGVAEISEYQIAESAQLATHLIANTLGRIDYINARYSHYTVDDTLARLGRHIERQRNAGLIYHTFIWDYAQLGNNPGEGNRVEDTVGKIKTFCGEWQMFGLITSQVNKSATRDSRSGGGLTEADGQFLRADKNNLVISASPVHIENTKLPYIRIDVNKNSTGRSGYIYLSSRGLERLNVDITQSVNRFEVEQQIAREKKLLAQRKKAMKREESETENEFEI